MRWFVTSIINRLGCVEWCGDAILRRYLVSVRLVQYFVVVDGVV